jgi:CubicO group peptidase (beta-lactamase class C family)
MAGLALLVLTSCGKNATAPKPVDHSLTGVLQRTLRTHHLPAIAGVVVRGDSVAEVAALGVRRLGAPDSVTLSDHFHLGSNVKAMTADLLALADLLQRLDGKEA